MLTRGPGGRARPVGRAVLAAGLLLGAGVAIPAPALADGEGPTELAAFCSQVADTEEPVANPDPSIPLEQMRIDEIHRDYTRGAGVGVAVIDSGVAPSEYYDSEPGLQVVDQPGPLQEPHGTIVAGLIAGGRRGEGEGMGMGVAPDARIIGVRIVGNPEESDDDGLDLDGDFDPPDLVTALRWVADNAGSRGIDVLNLSLTADPSDDLRDAVRAVQDAGVIVVAATGNRSPDEELPEDEPVPGPYTTYPAAYPGVVGVSAYVPLDAEGGSARYVLNTTNADVAVPVRGGASVVPNGSTCVVDAIATSWATPYVSGIVALLLAYFPDDDDAQIVQRLLETASGATDQRDVYTGFGLAQPIEAFTRQLTPARRTGELGLAQPADDGGGAAPAPPERADALADARDDFRWWGLLAGAVLVAAVVLRPLLRRLGTGRRTPG